MKKKIRQAHDLLIISEKMANLGKLVPGISHDINTKVGVCISAVSYLKDSAAKTRNQYKEDQIKRSDFEKHLNAEMESLNITMLNLEEASNLVRSFKDISIDQAKDTILTFNLETYIEKILLSLHPRIRKTEHSVNLSCDSSLQINMNPGLLSQILTNLINNSLIHGFENKEKGTITIQAKKEENDLLLHYSDNGKGIPEQNLSRIFQPYFTTRKDSVSSGLGLSIIHRLITKEAGGTIKCSSIPNVETSFSIRIPGVDPEYTKGER